MRPVEIEKDIANAISEILDESQFMVGLVVKGTQPNQKIELLIDGDDGVTIDNCGNVSRSLYRKLDEIGYSAEAFALEVSSPGIGHPLVSKRQFRSKVGRKLKLTMNDASEIVGELLSVDDQQIGFNSFIKKGNKVQYNELTVPFDAIAKAQEQISFK